MEKKTILLIIAALGVAGAALLFLKRKKAPTIPSGAVSRWKIDEGSGNIVRDSIGTNDGEIKMGEINWVNDPERGTVLDFAHNYVDMPYSESLNIGGPLSISFWFNLNELPSVADKTYYLVGRGNAIDAGGSYVLSFYKVTDQLFFDITDEFDTRVNIRSAKTDWEKNRWYHVVVEYDGINMFFWVDGLLDSSKASAIDHITTSLIVPFRIGLYNASYFNGLIDDMIVFNKALSETEISSLYNSQKK